MPFFASLARNSAAIKSFLFAHVPAKRADLDTPPETMRGDDRRTLVSTVAVTSFLLLAGSIGVQGQTATVDWATVHQTIQGFGGYTAWAPVGSYQSLLFNTLGYSLLRASLPTDDSCTPGPSASCGSGVSNTSDMQYCISHGCKVWATVSSPPADMKTNGSTNCTAVGATLVPGDYAAYATYMSNYIASLKNYYSVPLYAISADNEPDTCFNGAQPNSAFSAMSAANLDTFIKADLGPTLAANGQSGTLIMLPESSKYEPLTSYAGTCMADPSCASFVGITAYHDYDNPSSMSAPYPSTKFWETETSGYPGGGPSLTGGTWDPSIANAIMWARIVHINMVGGASAFHYFWYVDPLDENTDSALINPSQAVPIAIRTYAIAQWAKFVRPGWVRVDATENPVAGVDVTAFTDPSTGDFAIVAVNENMSASAVNFSLGKSDSTSVIPYVTSATLSLSPQSTVSVSNDSFSYSLSAQSITTFVGSALVPSVPSGLSAKVAAR